MERTGVYNWGTKAFTPYKLLLYRGRFNNDPEKDDKHRFIYLAQNKPGDPLVGDCFIRLEEVHNRMRGDKTPYVQDCQTAIDSATNNRRSLNFRCWAVEGKACYTHELELFEKLFSKISNQNKTSDHIEEFRVWAEILRKSQGDKLASKDFFGRYWDVVIPDGNMPMFTAGIRIVVSEKYFDDRGFDFLFNRITPKAREDVRKEVWEAIKRVIEAPRLKFKPTLSIQNVIFQNEVAGLPDGWNGLQTNLINNKGWRTLEPHPGDLYSILVNYPVQNFLCSSAHDKPLWQKGYAPPEKKCAEALHKLLDKCGKQKDTRTYVETKYVVAAGKAKRNPTQDRYEAFVKRLAYYSNNGNGGRVIVDTKIAYPVFFGRGQNWMGDNNHKYTWLAPQLNYEYQNDPNSKPRVSVTRPLYPLNLEGSMLFQALLDKSVESQCWGWNCWDDNAVAKALLESTAVDGDQDGPLHKDDLKDLLKQAVNGDQEGQPIPVHTLQTFKPRSIFPEVFITRAQSAELWEAMERLSRPYQHLELHPARDYDGSSRNYASVSPELDCGCGFQI
ncbi:hypothetical protein FGADI_2773 [Fusarium gaditjirri]|uniref:Uncharacterized protein n=1 Tax=Fusarium gaditjirri TaxID=282569 RepID=A0A8H4THN1_9HYPO|nr:hypothetical protein FGADI_2773 [Fusarium gaditjirri]